jgi:hypothetical protein
MAFLSSLDGRHVRPSSIEDHVIVVPSDAPDDQNDGGPEIPLRRFEAR